MADPTPIRQHRRYTKARKAQAVGIAMVEGVTQAERETGIPKETIQYWTTKPEFAQLRTTARETVAQELWIGVQIGARELVSGLQGDAPLNHKAAAFQALAERYALLNGDATSRTETLTGDLEGADRTKAKEVLRKATREIAG